MSKVLSVNRTPADFIAATRHLSVEDRGAYQEILDQIVVLGQDEDPPSLPNDDRMLAQLLGWPVAKWKRTKARLCTGPLAVLTIAGERISQHRIVQEIEAARERIFQASAAGKKSGESRRQKAEALRSRLVTQSGDAPLYEPLPASERPFELPFNERSTAVSTPVQPEPQPELNPEPNGTRTSHESRVTSHEEEERPTVSNVKPLSLPEKGIEALEVIEAALAAFAPACYADDFTVSNWLRAINPNPWWIAVIIAENAQKLIGVKSPKYLEAILRERQAAGWVMKTFDADDREVPAGPDDYRGYVEYALAAMERRRSA